MNPTDSPANPGLPPDPVKPIPAKRYFSISEVSELCGVKPHVLRYWEQEFTQLKPMKRRGNRRYYQHHEVLLIRRIHTLLYKEGFTISGARNRLGDSHHARDSHDADAAVRLTGAELHALRGELARISATLTTTLAEVDATLATT